MIMVLIVETREQGIKTPSQTPCGPPVPPPYQSSRHRKKPSLVGEAVNTRSGAGNDTEKFSLEPQSLEANARELSARLAKRVVCSVGMSRFLSDLFT